MYSVIPSACLAVYHCYHHPGNHNGFHHNFDALSGGGRGYSTVHRAPVADRLLNLYRYYGGVKSLGLDYVIAH